MGRPDRFTDGVRGVEREGMRGALHPRIRRFLRIRNVANRSHGRSGVSRARLRCRAGAKISDGAYRVSARREGLRRPGSVPATRVALRAGAFEKGSPIMITRAEAMDLYRSDDLIAIGMAADAVRRKLHPDGIVSYIIDRNINYTNFCTEYCSFCAFYRPLGAKDGYILPLEAIYEKIQEMLDLGGTGVLLQGGLHPDLQIEFYENMLRSIHERFPQVHLHCFSAPEITCIAEVSGLSIRETIMRLRDAGLVSIPGGGAEILDDEVRGRIARLKCKSEEWETVHREAHKLGMRTTATMMFGCGEEYRHRVNHLEKLRQIQEVSGGFTAFIPWIFAPENTPLGKKVPETTTFDYLK